MEILKAYGIPTKIVDAISILYKDTEAQVITPDGDTEFFEILAGVLQGDTLAPFLFIIALDYALREATRETPTLISRMILPKFLTILKRHNFSY